MKKNKIKCYVCRSERIEIFHHGTRDDAELCVYRCTECGLVFADPARRIPENYYESSTMFESANSNKSISDILALTYQDDNRRADMLRQYFVDADVLDYGCSYGGGLKCISKYAKSVVGVEIERKALDHAKGEGFHVVENVRMFNCKFDVITLFHVIEHLDDPLVILKELKKYLNAKGCIIIETPNAEEALLSLYKNEAFRRFTLWSAHRNLFNEGNLKTLCVSAGYDIVETKQIQRYPLSNHLCWNAEGKPGGHMNAKYSMFNSQELNAAYTEVLKCSKMADTIMVVIN